MNDTILSHQNVEILKLEDKEVYLVGTAHVSSESIALAEDLIRLVRPDAVAIELCESRYKALQDPQRWKKTDLLTVIREGRTFVLVLQILLASFQKKLGKLLHVKPGEEMLRAATVAKENGASIVFADRDIKVTLKRTWRNIRFGTIMRLIWSWLHSIFEPHEFKKEDVERLKSPDVLNELMEELAREMPDVKEPLIEERDKYLSHKIKTAPGTRIVAVLGAGHITGVKAHLKENIDILPLESVPPRSLIARVIRWSVLFAFVALILYAFISSGINTGVQLLSAWFWVTAFSAALGSLLVFAHPLTICSAFISAPFTTFPPLIGAGWVAGLVEAWIRKPQVEDFEKIIDDASSFKGLWKNRVSRILLIMAFSNVGAALGAASRHNCHTAARRRARPERPRRCRG
ncbi:MAG: TraB/GumN family protein [SAR324 cluster bacterium]|uniref:TraB/GumN family protein n=1 Tax=SAR324 cluster bacterium TaxID=2024889 RepID=A0A7X9FQ76_9DELT|nr:TraB/GumN family protein [SAR324 cluster bacterium]